MRRARIERPNVTYAREIERVRTELLALCGLSDLAAGVILAASGTDLHLIASQLASRNQSQPLLAVMIEPTETGSGVPLALAGRHFDQSTALGRSVVPGERLVGAGSIEVATVAGRMANGSPRSLVAIDAEVESLVVHAVSCGQRVLLNLADVSKTGILAPSLACAAGLYRRFPDLIDVLVDGCQFRLAPSTLRAYVQCGFWVAITGSKFAGGPAFSGALIVPRLATTQLRTLTLGLRDYSARADWPQSWLMRHVLPDVENYGLLLRWEAALVGLRAFSALPDTAIAEFLQDFARAVEQRLANDPVFRRLPTPDLDRRPVADNNSWDRVPTIFPFILHRLADDRDRGWPLTCDETKQVYSRLPIDAVKASPTSSSETRDALVLARRCHVGQPVRCGTVDGVDVSALRLCASMNLVVDAIATQGRGPNAVIADALSVLDKVALLATNP